MPLRSILVLLRSLRPTEEGNLLPRALVLTTFVSIMGVGKERGRGGERPPLPLVFGSRDLRTRRLHAGSLVEREPGDTNMGVKEDCG